MSLKAEEFTVGINGTGLLPGTLNTYRTYFNSDVIFDNWELSIVNLSLFNALRNVTAAYGNNSFSYKWVDGTIVPVSIPDGSYSIDNIGSFMQNVMTTNKHYIIYTNPSTGITTNIFLLTLTTNPTYYGAQLTSLPVDTTLYPSPNYSLPTGATWSLPLTATNPQFIVPAGSAFNNNTFGSLLGFPSGSYPAAQTPGAAYDYVSGYFSPTSASGGTSAGAFVPTISPVQSVVVRCNLCLNAYVSTPNTIASFSFGNVGNGQAFSLNPSELNWQPITPGVSYPYVEVSFYDQSGNALNMIDPNISVQLDFRRRRGLIL